MEAENFYEILNVSRSATEEEIRRSFLKLIKLYHPDKQTDLSEKKKLNKRFVLLNSAYTTLINPETRRKYDKKLNSIVFCTLEEAYAGTEKVIDLASEALDNYDSRKVLISIPRGVKTGDIIEGFEIYVKKHPAFKRVEDDLCLKLHVPFFLMISGCSSFPVKHISGEDILLSWSRVIKPYETVRISDKGMPIKGTSMYGDLHITFIPEFPDFIDSAKATRLRKLFVSESHVTFFQKTSKESAFQI